MRRCRGIERIASAGSPTAGVVAACRNSAMLMDFGRGRHWVSAYRARFQRELPPLQLQVCTKFKPIGVVLPEGVYSLRRDVRFRMRSRTHVLDPSLTGRDPTRTFRVAARLLPPCNSKCRLGATGPSRDYRSQVRNKVLGSSWPQRRIFGWPFGERCDGAAGSKAISGDFGCRRGRLLCVDATR